MTSAGVGLGTSYYHLQFTNQSGHTCALLGYPDVSAVNLRGEQIGKSASRNTSTDAPKVVTVTLRSGGTATALLGIADALNYPSSICHEEAAAGLRVAPPDQTASKVVPFPFLVCSRNGPNVLILQVIQKTPSSG